MPWVTDWSRLSIAMMKATATVTILLAPLVVHAVDTVEFEDPPCYGVSNPQCSDTDLDVIASTQGTDQTWFDMLHEASYVSLGNLDKAVQSLSVQASNVGVQVSHSCFVCQARSATCNFFKCGFSKCFNPQSKKCLECLQRNCALVQLCGGDPAMINIPEDEHGPATWLRTTKPEVKCSSLNASTSPTFPPPPTYSGTEIQNLEPQLGSQSNLGLTNSSDSALNKVQDCKISDWTEWSTCNVECGGGVRQRSRALLEQASPAQMQCVPTHTGQISVEECSILNKLQCKAELLCSWKLHQVAGRRCPSVLHQVARCNSRSCVPLPEECTTADDSTSGKRLQVTAVYTYVPPGGSLDDTYPLGVMTNNDKYLSVKQTEMKVFPCRGLSKIESALTAGECQEFCLNDVGCTIWSWNNGCYQSSGVGTQWIWCSGETLSRLDIWGQIFVWGSTSVAHQNKGRLAVGLAKVPSISDIEEKSLGQDLCKAICLSSLDCSVWQWGMDGCWVESKPFYRFQSFRSDVSNSKVTAGETILHSCDPPKYPHLHKAKMRHHRPRRDPRDRDAHGGKDETHPKEKKKGGNGWSWWDWDNDEPKQKTFAKRVPNNVTDSEYDDDGGKEERAHVVAAVAAFGVGTVLMGGLASVTSHHVPLNLFTRSFMRSRASMYRHEESTARSLASESMALTGPVDL